MADEPVPDATRADQHSRPSASALAEIGVLRNGLGSIQNLKLLLESIRVGQKGLFAAIAAVHADCAAMVASASALRAALAPRVADSKCIEQLCALLAERVRELDTGLAAIVRIGRLSVPRRLELERALVRVERDLGAALPLVELCDAANRPPPNEPVPLELVHGSGGESADPIAVSALLSIPRALAGRGLAVELGTAKLLVAVAVALARGQAGTRKLSIGVQPARGTALVTTIAWPPESRASEAGVPVRFAPVGVIEPTLGCARSAAAASRSELEYVPEASRVCIYWPVS